MYEKGKNIENYKLDTADSDSQILRILILEDIETDAELMNRKLKKAKFNYEAVVVDNKKDFQEKVLSFNPELILSDYSLPQFNALEALEFLKDNELDIPFILVTGSQSEEVAVECIKRGASDYILKTSLTRLPSAVESALIKKKIKEENQKIQMALVESEQRYKSLFENNPDAVFSFDFEGKFVDGNSALEKLTGYTIEDLKGKPYLPIVHPDYLKITIESFNKAAKGKPQNYDNAGIHKSGKIFYTNVTNIPIYVKGKIVGVYGIAKDITEKKRADKLIRENNAYLEYIVKIQQEILSVAGNSQETLKILAPKAQELLAADGATVELLEGEYLVYKSASGNLSKSIGTKIKLTGSLSGLCFRTGEVLICEDTEVDNRVSRELYRELDIRSMVVLPLTMGNQKAGVLKISFTKPRIFTEEEIRTLKLVTGFFVAGLNLGYEFEEKQKSINEKNKALELLSESEQRYRILAENSIDVIATHDADGAFIYVSPACRKVLGYEPEDLIGRKPSEFVHPDDINHFLSLKNERLTGVNKIMTFQYRMKKKDGSYLHLESSSNRLSDKPVKDKPFLISITRDISERKKNESIIHRLGQILNNSLTEVFFFEDNTHKFIQVNQAALDNMGYTYDEMMEMKPFDIDPLYDAEKFEKMAAMLKSGEKDELTFEGIHKRKDGTIYPVEIRVQYSAREDPPVYLSIVQDITERKEVEAELRLLHKSVEESNDLVMITDAENIDDPLGPKIIFVNEAVEKISGYKKEEVIGKTPRIFQGEKTDRTALDRIRKALVNKESIKEEIVNYSKSGNKYWVELNISPIKNEDGNCTHFIAVERDVTEKKLFQQELIEAKEKAEEMNRLKSNFLANMSHELRTPMIGILGYAELLKEEINDDEHRDMATVIKDSGERLLETLNLLLDLSRIEAGKMDIKLNKIDLVDLVRNRCRIFESAAREKSLSYVVELPNNPVNGYLDERLFSEIINNLVNNAIKFTESGVVFISFKKIEISGKEFGELKVRDTGIGIPSDQLDIIFEEFRQSSEGYGRSFEGAGLGLTLTKKFVKKLEGEISVESIFGKGSTFTVKIPIQFSNSSNNAEDKDPGSTGELSID